MVLYICTTYYHVYITLLKQLAKPQSMDLVICDDIPTGKTLADKLRKSGLFQHVWFVRQSQLPDVPGKNKLDCILFQHRRRYRVLTPLLPFRLEHYQDIYLFHDGTLLGMYLQDAGRPYHLIEDSLNFYQRIYDTPQAKLLPHKNLKYRLRKLLRMGYFPLGEYHRLIDIEVNQNTDLAISFPRIMERPRRELAHTLTAQNTALLLDLFDVPLNHMDSSNCTLILTEPLFQDGICQDEHEQLLLYKTLISKLKKRHSSIMLKPHPRDLLDYSPLQLPVMKREYPIELLNCLIPAPFACVAAVSSSAVFTVQAKEKLFFQNEQLIKVSE